MFLKTVRDIARPQVAAILEAIKRSMGLSVAELSRSLDMSYMGVKQYCLELERKGYLDTWRRPKTIGRPELTYRLTAKAQALFPQMSNDLTLGLLRSVRQCHGPTAADKLLFNYFAEKAEGYLRRIKGHSIAERAWSLARLREQEGYCSQADYDPGLGLRLIEYHSPFSGIGDRHPSIWRMEEAMLARVLQTTVSRSEERVAGVFRYTFLIETLAPKSTAATSAEAKSQRLALSH
jgi:predicted ArsR family transcriptional regulator